MSIDKASPDHSVLSRFRTELTQKKVYDKVYDKVLKALNKQLEKHKIIIKTGAIVDASITESPLKYSGKASYEIVEDRSETEPSQEQEEKQREAVALIKKIQPGVDTEASWVKKPANCNTGIRST